MDEIRFIDTTLRDGQTSLWAGRLSAGAMLPAMSDIDAAGYDGAEFQGGSSRFVRAVQEMHDDPWDWLRLGTPRAPHTDLRMHGAGTGSFSWVPEAVRELTLGLKFAYGLTSTRISDYWNNAAGLKEDQELLERFGFRVVMSLIYSVSPRHTTEYYRERARNIAALNPYRICLKDVSGLLTPERTKELVPVILSEIGDIPLEIHAHSNNGLAPFNCLVAAQMGVRIIHTAIPPLANGSSQPSIFNVAANLEALGFAPAIDLEPLKRVSEHFTNVARIEHFPIGAPREYDQRVYNHQVPGGMISHLTFQLQKLGLADQLEATLVETAQVRKDLGYPIMVTPLSQFVGSQAAINIFTRERYTTVTDEVIKYALGQYGAEAIEVMDPEVRAKILDRPRAEELENFVRVEPTIEEIRQKFGTSVSDEEIVARFFVGEEAAAVFSNPKQTNYPTTYEAYLAVHRPLASLLTNMVSSSNWHYLELHDGTTQLSIARE